MVQHNYTFLFFTIVFTHSNPFKNLFVVYMGDILIKKRGEIRPKTIYSSYHLLFACYANNCIFSTIAKYSILCIIWLDVCMYVCN